MPSSARFLAGVVVATASLACGQSAGAARPSCTNTVSGKVPAPSVAPGYEARVIATNLYSPRGLAFDSAGNLLVVQKNSGIVALRFNDAGGSCLSEENRRVVSNDTSLNHGIIIDDAGHTLYASSAEAVHRYPYDPQNASISGPDSVIVSNMTTDDHTTRTLLLSRRVNGTLIVTRGSTSNLDPEAAELASGHSQIKSFDLNRLPAGRPYNFNTDGELLGSGLRNDVGIAEEPYNGGLYAVENSADEVNRNGRDIHQNNPAEKLNFLGWVAPPQGVQQSTNQGGNFGYPQCFAAWEPSEIPDFGDGQVGQQFVIGSVNATNNDTYCQSRFVPPRLSFLAHMAPLDIKFNTQGNTAWITFHGSWDRSNPSGYKIGAVEFANGQPTANRTSKTALVDIVSNPNSNRDCPNNCFRPVAMAWDRQGRLYFSSDATGEIYVVTRAGTPNNAAGVDSASAASGPSPTAPGSPPTASQSGSASMTRSATAMAYAISMMTSLLHYL